MIYHLNYYVGWDATVAKMVTEYCNRTNMRVHTFTRIEPPKRKMAPRYMVLFEKEES